MPKVHPDMVNATKFGGKAPEIRISRSLVDRNLAEIASATEIIHAGDIVVAQISFKSVRPQWFASLHRLKLVHPFLNYG